MLSFELRNSQSPNDLPAKSEPELETIELEDKSHHEANSMPISYQAPKKYHFIFLIHVDKSSVGVANVVIETAWVRNLLHELHALLFTATLVYCDNVSAIYLSNNPVQHQRTNHIEIDIHFVCDFVASRQVCVLHVPSRFQYADIFTNGLPSALFLEFRSSLNVRRPPAPTTRVY
ncbi:ribonuclease H-like domain-containing protein [Tanacetum coccineum]